MNPKKFDKSIQFVEGIGILREVLDVINPATGKPWNHALTDGEAGGFVLSDRLRNLVSWVVRSGPEHNYIDLDEDDPVTEALFGLPIRLAAMHGAIDAHTTIHMGQVPNRLGSLDDDGPSVILTPSDRRWEKLTELGYGPDKLWTSRFPLLLTDLDGWQPPVDLMGSPGNFWLVNCADDRAFMESLVAMNMIALTSQPGHEVDRHPGSDKF